MNTINRAEAAKLLKARDAVVARNAKRELLEEVTAFVAKMARQNNSVPSVFWPRVIKELRRKYLRDERLDDD